MKSRFFFSSLASALAFVVGFQRKPNKQLAGSLFAPRVAAMSTVLASSMGQFVVLSF
jgi:hypothetical protein